MKYITRMLALREMVETIPKRLNPLIAPAHSFEFCGFFVHSGDGYGIYPRFRTSAEWRDLEQRVAAFKKAIANDSKRWSEFLSWCPGLTGAGDIKERLRGDLNQIAASALYEMLLAVMLATPASWADRDYWQIQQGSSVQGEPFLARWEKLRTNDPWHLTAQRIKEGKLFEIGRADVASGSLPEPTGHLAPIFWEYLYPLCRRAQFNPPQDPAKYATGKFLELILPSKHSGGNSIAGWVNCHIASDSKPFELLLVSSQEPFLTEWAAIEREIDEIMGRI